MKREDERGKKKGESWERQLREGTWEGNTGEGKGAGNTLTVFIFVLMCLQCMNQTLHNSGCVPSA